MSETTKAGEGERSLLLVDDDVGGRKALAIALKRKGWQVFEAAHGREALDQLAREAVDMIVSDLNMPVMNGLEFLDALRRSGAWTPVLLVTAFAEIGNVVKAMRAGADDVLAKPYDLTTLLFRIEKSLEMHRLVRTNRRLATQAKAPFVVGESRAMQAVMRQVRAVARTPAPVLIQGESGTGKELMARHVHDLSPRSASPFVVVFCGALPENLVESELFGHERGAFTGADVAKRGLVEEARGGTLFLDEVGELSPAVQVKLLRLLQEGEIRRVGATTVTRVDVRIVAATNRDLATEVEAGRFREDLYFRLKVVPITLPPLRERMEDLPLLLEHFRLLVNREYGRSVVAFSPEVVQGLVSRDWPGNIRELENRIRELIILCPGDVVLSRRDEDADGESSGRGPTSPFDPLVFGPGEQIVPYRQAREAMMDGFDRSYLDGVLRRTGGNVTEAARLARRDRREFHRLMQKRGVVAEDYRGNGGDGQEEP